MALYHTYRPQTFADVVGQTHIVQTISNQITNKTVAHAYLFSGPRGVGKTTTARLIAKAINCQNKTKGSAEPCNTCHACTEIQLGRAIDVMEIDAASHTGVDNVREHVIDNAHTQPTLLPHKVFIIDEVHMLSTSAFNALLKTLEEPPSYVVFILATTELHKLPDTIISRCQRFAYKPVDPATLKEHLLNITTQENKQVDEQVLNHIIGKSDGCVRDAVSLLEQLFSLGEDHITEENAALFFPPQAQEYTLAFLEALFAQDAAKAFTALHDASVHGMQLEHLATEAISLVRHIMIAGLDTDYTLPHELSSHTTLLSHSFAAKDFVTLMDILLQRKRAISSSPLPTLPLELATVEWLDTLNPPSSIPPAPNTDTSPISSQKTPKPKLESKPQPKKESSTPPSQKNEIIASIPKSIHDKPTPKKQEDTLETTNTVKHTTPTGSITIQDVQKHWPAFLALVEKDSPSILFLLKMSKLEEVSDNTVVISVGHAFHKDKLTDTKSLPKLNTMLSSTMNTPIQLDVYVDDEKSKDTSIQDIAHAFGGEVIG